MPLETAGTANKPYEQLSPDEKRVAPAQVRAAGETWNLWKQVGLPMPPRHLRHGQQPDLL